MKRLTVSSEQWLDAYTPDSSMTDLIADMFPEDCNIFLYSACNMRRESALDELQEYPNVHIGFYGCACTNEFSTANTNVNAHFSLCSTTIEYPDLTNDGIASCAIRVDKGSCLSAFISIKVTDVHTKHGQQERQDIPIARITYPNTICVLVRPSDIPNSLLEYILSESKKYLYCSESEFKTFLRNFATDNLLKTLRFPFNRQRGNIISEIEAIKNSIADMEQRIKAKEEELLLKERQLISISEYCDDTGGISEILSSISAIEKIASVQSSSGHELLGEGLIRIVTDTIYVICQKQRYMLGKYEIELNFLAHKVSFRNLVPELRRKSFWGNKCHHPHVSCDGSACLGNIKEDIKEALKAFDFQYAVLLAVSFLKNVNINDVAGKGIINWPVVDDEGNVIRDSTEQLLNCHICGKVMPDDIDNAEWTECEICGRTTCPEHMNSLIVGGRNISVCSYCEGTSIKQCHSCGKSELIDNMFIESALSDDGFSTIVETSNHICADCANAIDIVVPASPDILAHKTIFVTDEFVENHIKECEICGEKFVTTDGEECQCPYCRNGGTYFICPDCGALTITSRGITVLKNGVETLVCNECFDGYVTCMQCLNSVREGEYSVVSSANELYICNNCQDNLTEEVNENV